MYKQTPRAHISTAAPSYKGAITTSGLTNAGLKDVRNETFKLHEPAFAVKKKWRSTGNNLSAIEISQNNISCLLATARENLNWGIGEK
jgi:hypothetical protein